MKIKSKNISIKMVIKFYGQWQRAELDGNWEKGS